MNRLCFASNLTSSEWAAWVQAIGSIAAIFAAIWIMSYQQRREAARERNRRFERTLVLAAYIENVVILFESVSGHLDIEKGKFAGHIQLGPPSLGEFFDVVDWVMAQIDRFIQRACGEQIHDADLARCVNGLEMAVNVTRLELRRFRSNQSAITAQTFLRLSESIRENIAHGIKARELVRQLVAKEKATLN